METISLVYVVQGPTQRKTVLMAVPPAKILQKLVHAVEILEPTTKREFCNRMPPESGHRILIIDREKPYMTYVNAIILKLGERSLIFCRFNIKMREIFCMPILRKKAVAACDC